MEERKSFLFYMSHYEAIKNLDNDTFARLIRAVFEYQKTGIETAETDLKIAFNFIKIQLDLDAERYRNMVEKNKENGKNGGRPPTIKNPKKPKKPSGLFENPKNPSEPKKPNNDDVDVVVDVVVDDFKNNNLPQTKVAEKDFSKKEKKLNNLQKLSNIILETFEPEIKTDDQKRIWFKKNCKVMSELLAWTGQDIDAVVGMIKVACGEWPHEFTLNAVIRNASHLQAAYEARLKATQAAETDQGGKGLFGNFKTQAERDLGLNRRDNFYKSKQNQSAANNFLDKNYNDFGDENENIHK
jgi:hypothetical protein